MENPFVYGEEVSESSFTNREEEVKELLMDLRRGQNVIIYSPRRYGKTSLIKRVINMLRKEGLITIYVDLYKATSKAKFIDIYARAVAEQTMGNLQRALSRIKSLLPRLLPKITIREKGLPEIDFEYNHTKPVSPLLDSLLDSAAKISQKRRKNAVVVFDEFQEIANFEDDEIERAMRSHFQSHRNVSYVFMGSRQHLMKNIFFNKNRPFYRSGKHFQLGKIREDKFGKFILNNFNKAKIEVKPKLIAQILSMTECHPYYTQLFCCTLWDYAVENNKTIINSHDNEVVFEKVITRESHAYEEIWEGLSANKRTLMEALAKYEKVKIFSAEFIQANNLGSSSSIQRAAKSLEKQGLIEKQNGDYLVEDVFFKLWLLRNIS